jgi:hypothetical protein
MSNDEPILYATRAAYIAALIADVDTIVAEELPYAGRAHRRRAMKIAEIQAKQNITPELWETRLQGNADEQEFIGAEFLRSARIGFISALEEMGYR